MESRDVRLHCWWGPQNWRTQVFGHAPIHHLGHFLDRFDVAALETTSPTVQESFRKVIRTRNEKLPAQKRMIGIGGWFSITRVLKELLKREGRYPLDIVATGGEVPSCRSTNRVMAVDLVTKQFHELSPMSTLREFHSTVYLNGGIFVMGGFGALSARTLATCEVLDLQSGLWSPMASLSVPRECAAAASVGGDIYVVGGKQGLFPWPLASVECFDPGTDKWKPVAPMNTPRMNHGVISANGKIYVIGGHDVANRPLKTGECFDPATGTWTHIASMSEARAFLAIAVLDNKLYAIGGKSLSRGTSGEISVATVECLDLQAPNGQWLRVARMLRARSNHGVAVTSGKIFVIGGNVIGGDELTPPDFECFDPNLWPLGGWTEFPAVSSKFMAGARFCAC